MVSDERVVWEKKWKKQKIIGWAKKIAWFLCQLVLVTVAYYAFNWVFHNPYCNFMFTCGCTWNWEGGWDECNIHNETGPKCPWCSSSPPVAKAGGIFIFLTTITSYFLIAYLPEIRASIQSLKKWKNRTPKTLSTASEFDDEVSAMEQEIFLEALKEQRCFSAACAINVVARITVPMAVWTIACTIVGIIVFLIYSGYPTFFGIQIN